MIIWKYLNEAKKLQVPIELKIMDYLGVDIFSKSSKTLCKILKTNNSEPETNNFENNKFNFYGYLKYASSTLFMLFSLVILNFSWYSFPISILIFYLTEIHFLFVFPNLISGEKQVLLNSIKKVYQIGLMKSLFNTLFLACYMILGLLNFKSPLEKWLIACISIVLWNEEINNRT
jgi:hypothetical protein